MRGFIKHIVFTQLFWHLKAKNPFLQKICVLKLSAFFFYTKNILFVIKKKLALHEVSHLLYGLLRTSKELLMKVPNKCSAFVSLLPQHTSALLCDCVFTFIIFSELSPVGTRKASQQLVAGISHVWKQPWSWIWASELQTESLFYVTFFLQQARRTSKCLKDTREIWLETCKWVSFEAAFHCDAG